MLNPPINKTELNIGPEDAPDEIITPEFLFSFPDSDVDEFVFPNPQSIAFDSFNQVLVNEFGKAAGLIKQTLQANQTQAVIGGDHSVTFAALLALLSRVSNPAEIGYIQIDSHADLNLYKNSPTKNFHGMYLRPVVDNFDVPEIDALIINKLPSQNMWYIGNLDLDPEEKLFFESRKIKNTTKEQIDSKPVEFQNQLREFANQHKYLHVSLDVDGLDKTLVLATGLPAENGLLLKHILPVLSVVKTHQNLSFDLVELNPTMPGSKEAITLCRDLLLSVLK